MYRLTCQTCIRTMTGLITLVAMFCSRPSTRVLSSIPIIYPTSLPWNSSTATFSSLPPYILWANWIIHKLFLVFKIIMRQFRRNPLGIFLFKLVDAINLSAFDAKLWASSTVQTGCKSFFSWIENFKLLIYQKYISRYLLPPPIIHSMLPGKEFPFIQQQIEHLAYNSDIAKTGFAHKQEAKIYPSIIFSSSPCPH